MQQPSPQPKVWEGEKVKVKEEWDVGMDMESCQVPKDPGSGLFDKGLGRVKLSLGNNVPCTSRVTQTPFHQEKSPKKIQQVQLF